MAVSPPVFRRALALFTLAIGCGGSAAPEDASLVDAADAMIARCDGDGDCDDGLFCNGVERCTAGRCTTSPLACDDEIACTTDFCNEAMRSCTSQPPDLDMDGFGDAECRDALGISIGTDCDDDDDDAFPGNRERCDDHDEDCDPETLGGFDTDRDGAIPDGCCNPASEEGAPPACGLDCNDSNPSISQLATEICDGIDNDCDESIDEHVMLKSWPDLDGDGYGDADATPEIVCLVPSSHANQGGDCDDTSLDVHPTASERCNGVDDDCDAATDEGASTACLAGLSSTTAECIAGACVVTGCAGTRFDCNDGASDGCEISLCDTPRHCGLCGQSCASIIPGTCRDGECNLVAYLPRDVSGTLVDAVTGAPVAGATITSVDICPAITAITRADGTYTLTVVASQPRWIRIEHASHPTHVQPLDAWISIFPSTTVDAWRADPDALTPPSSSRAILVVDGASAGGIDDAHVGMPNGRTGTDLVVLPMGDDTVYPSVVPGHVHTGGTSTPGGGCIFHCTPELNLWMEPGTITHIGEIACGGVC